MKTLRLFLTVQLIFASLAFVSCSKDDGVETNKRIDYKNGYYVGDVKDGKPHGKGTYYRADGDKYEGDWVDGKRTGKGTYYWANGNKYEGDYVDNARTGKGTFYRASGEKYEGDFVDGVRAGKGTFYRASGDKYEGDWVDGEMTGKGTYYWVKNGDKYEGDFVVGSRTGTGKMTWKDGTAITCQWDKGTPVNTDNKIFALWALKCRYYWNDKVGVLSSDKYASVAAMLDGEKYVDDTRSSVYDVDTQEEIFQSGREIGYGFGVRWNAGNDLRVAYVYPGSPAANAGLRRGWKITEVNGTPVTEELAQQISTSETGKSLTLQLVKPDTSTASQTLVSANYGINSVLHSEVVQITSKKVGYLALKSFVEPNETEIKNAVSTMNNVHDLILDLRYCAGGDYSVMCNTANLLAPTSANEKLLLLAVRNSARGTGLATLVKKSGGLNLNRIIVLTGPGTAALGEWLIAGLQPYMDVVLIGSKTDGTNAYGVTGLALPDKKQNLVLVTELVVNSASKNTLGGLTPAHSVADGLDRNWGDREESLLKAALKFVETGQTKSNLTRAAGQSQLPVVREYAPVKALPLPKEEVFPIADTK